MLRVSYLLHILLILVFYAGRTTGELEWLFNADTLFLPSLFTDLFVNGNSITHWHTTPAPYFFPDMLFYFPIRWLISDLRWAMLVYCALQYLFLLFMMGACVKIAYPKASNHLLTISNFLLSLFILSGILSADALAAGLMLTLSFHMGAFVCSVLCFFFLLKYLAQGRSVYLGLYALVVVMGVPSDRLLIIMHFLPMAAVIAYLFMLKHTRAACILSAFFLASFASGWMLFEMAKRHLVTIPPPTRIEALPSVQVFFSHMGTYLSSPGLMLLILLLAIFSFAANIAAFAARHRTAALLPAVYHLFISLFAIILLAGTVLLGYYKGPDCLRYNIHSYYLLLFALPASILQALPRKKMKFAAISATALLALAIVSAPDTYQLPRGMARYSNFKPEVATLMDNNAHRFKAGVSDYWTAKILSVFSERGLHVAATYDNLVPVLHESSELEYLGEGNPRVFNYVLGLDPGATGLIPLDTITLEYLTVYIVEDFMFLKNGNGEIRHRVLKQ